MESSCPLSRRRPYRLLESAARRRRWQRAAAFLPVPHGLALGAQWAPKGNCFCCYCCFSESCYCISLRICHSSTACSPRPPCYGQSSGAVLLCQSDIHTSSAASSTDYSPRSRHYTSATPGPCQHGFSHGERMAREGGREGGRAERREDSACLLLSTQDASSVNTCTSACAERLVLYHWAVSAAPIRIDTPRREHCLCCGRVAAYDATT